MHSFATVDHYNVVEVSELNKYLKVSIVLQYLTRVVCLISNIVLCQILTVIKVGSLSYELNGSVLELLRRKNVTS